MRVAKAMFESQAVRRALACFCVALLFGLNVTSSAETSETGRHAVMPSEHAALFRTYCYECHDADGEEAGVNLENISYTVSRDIENASLWQKVLNAINSGEMPPEDSESIPNDLKLQFLEDLTTQMVEARKILGDAGGVVPLRRLNRREYSNTIESLLGIRPDVSSLPNDQVGAGFDTQGASLFMSSDQIEQYLSAARRALRLCFETPSRSRTSTKRVEPEHGHTEKYSKYLDTLRENAKKSKAFLGQSDKPSSAFGILDTHQAKRYVENHKNWSTQLEQYLAWPETKTGVSLIMTIKAGGLSPIKLPPLHGNRPGRYRVRVRAAMYPDAEERFHYLEFTSFENRNRKHLGWRKVTASLDAPQIIEFQLDHHLGKKLSLQVHQRTHQDRGDKALWTRAQKENGVGLPPGIWIDWVEVVGPEANAKFTEARERILSTKPEGVSDEQYVRDVLKSFAKRAFRGRVPTDSYLEKLYGHYLGQRDAGADLQTAIVEPLAIMLSSPEFLYMLNAGSEEAPDRLSDHELAVRLSYALWSAPPDDELIHLAEQGTLREPDVLRQQTDRLLDDPRSDEFVRDFTHQWLQMDRLGMFQFNGLRFPKFDNAVRENAREEIFQTVKYLLHERLSLGELLNANFVVINDLMAGYYGIPNVSGHEFRKVAVGAESVRGGLLGTAAVAAMGSDGLRTSPVERGAWVLRHLLNDPPAPAPPNVPQLSRLEGKPISARKLQRLHQEEPQCAQCHRKIDPIGFGLENFGADGLWREKEQVITGKLREIKAPNLVEFEIDSSGTLPGGEAFSDYRGLRSLIAKKQESFARGFAESLIAYGMGRPFGFTDEPLAEEMMKHASKDNFPMHSFIHTLVQSKTFQAK